MSERDKVRALQNLSFIKSRQLEMGEDVFGEDDNLRDLIIPPASLGATVRRRSGIEYFFDNDYILRTRPCSTRGAWQLDKKIFPLVHCGIWSKAIAICKEGTTADEFLEKYLTTKLSDPSAPNWSFIERLCTKVEKPTIERRLDNDDIKTFDHIRVEVCINSSMYASMQELLTGLRNHRKEIDALVLRQIEECYEFKKFGLSVNTLTVTSLKLAQDFTLEYIFEPKSITVFCH